MSAPLAIEIEGLTKAYGAVRALRGVDLGVRAGEIFGFLGPNGAGKTTTIQCLLEALLLSLLLPARRLAASLAGLVLVGSFFLTTLARLDDTLADWEKLSPLHYDQGGQALVELNTGWLIGLFGAAGLLVGLAWWRFLRRDIRCLLRRRKLGPAT